MSTSVGFVRLDRRHPAVLPTAIVAAIVMILQFLVMAPQAQAAEADCTGGSLYVVPHQDDDLLFISPDLLTDVAAKRCVTTLFLTAGDAGYYDDYWQSREQGIEAAYANMAGVSNAWGTKSVSLAGKSVRMRTLNAAPSISVVFMRLPDGLPLGTGTAQRGYQSLKRLLEGSISTINAVDGSASYTGSTLRNAVLDMMRAKNATMVRTLDYVTYYGADQDHFDHHSAAFITRDASDNYGTAHLLRSYLGYGDSGKGAWPANVSGSNLTGKRAAFQKYAAYDDEINMSTYESYGWITRQYVIASAGPAVAADAGPNQSVATGTQVKLDASGSSGSGSLSYKWTQSAGPSVSLSSTTSATPTFTPTAVGTYTFKVTVTSGGSSASASVSVSVTSATSQNLARLAGVTATASSAASGQGAAAVIDGSALGYPDDSSKEWASAGGKAGTWVQLTFPSAIQTDQVVLYDRPNTNDQVLGGTLTFSDGTTVPVGQLANAGPTTIKFASKVTTTIKFTVNQVSSTTENIGLAEFEVYGSQAKNPVANAGANQNVLTGATVTLDGSGSTNPGSGTLTYSWTQTAGPTVTLTGPTTAKPTFVPTQADVYKFELTASNSAGSSKATVQVTATAPAAPTADAGADQAVATNAQVTLDGSRSTNPNTGTTLTYLWKQTGGTSVTLANPSTVKPTFTPPSDGVYTFELTVTSASLSSTDTVQVTASPAPPKTPTADAGPDQSVALNASVSLDGSKSTNPNSGTTLTYLWEQTAGPSASLSDASAVKPTFTAATAGLYTFKLTVTSSSLSASDTVQITVTDPNQVLVNLAREPGVSATASSQRSNQQASKAIDGVIKGYPADETKEWATNKGKAGSWIKLTFSSPVSVQKVVLYDRPNTADQVLSGTLKFSDGTSVAVGQLDNAGAATTVSFPARTVTSVQFTIDKVSTSTYETGLAEFEVWGVKALGATTSAPPPPATTTSEPPPPATTTSAPPSPDQVNVARLSTVTATASSQLSSSPAKAAIDGVISGYPAAPTKEWSTNRGKANSWIKLTWASVVTVNKIVLYDRPNLDDQILSGTLTFSDGSTVDVGTLDNAGGPITVTFDDKTITSVQFTVKSVSSSTYETGLAEIEVWGTVS